MFIAQEAVDSISRAYDAAAQRYDSWPWSAFWQQHEMPVVADVIAAQPRGLLVDAGCGTGRYLAVADRLRLPHVGLDVSPGMLSIAASKGSASHTDQRFALTDMRHTGLPAGSAAIVLCARTLCHLADARAAFTEFRRLLGPGGSLIITDLSPTFRIPVTRLPTAGGKIDVPTYRRSCDELIAESRPLGFEPRDRFDLGGSPGDAHFVLHLTVADQR